VWFVQSSRPEITDMIRIVTRVLMLVCLTGSIVQAQVVNPADKQEKPADQQKPEDTSRHTWDAPPVEVYGKAPLDEEDRIGDYAQPRWTTHRRFGETRVYVIPKGTVEFEYWFSPEIPKDSDTQFENQYEFEFGLPHRFQLDIYAVGHKTGKDGDLSMDGHKAELRYAFADWDKIWGNPTLYLEWKQIGGAPDHIEAKMLFGGQITSGWHWGSNLVWEHELGNAQENSNEWTTGVSYSAIDSKVGVGVETQLALVNQLDGHGGRTPFENQFVIGPSLQFRPLPQIHLDVAPLFGVTPSAPRAKVFVVFGWEF
jgi:hypothetical protein